MALQWIGDLKLLYRAIDVYCASTFIEMKYKFLSWHYKNTRPYVLTKKIANAKKKTWKIMDCFTLICTKQIAGYCWHDKCYILFSIYFLCLL